MATWENAKMEKSDLSLNTYVQYVEAAAAAAAAAAGTAHLFAEKDVVKIFVSGLKP